MPRLEGDENGSESERYALHSEQVRVMPHKVHIRRTCGEGSKSPELGNRVMLVTWSSSCQLFAFSMLIYLSRRIRTKGEKRAVAGDASRRRSLLH